MAAVQEIPHPFACETTRALCRSGRPGEFSRECLQPTLPLEDLACLGHSAAPFADDAPTIWLFWVYSPIKTDAPLSRLYRLARDIRGIGFKSVDQIALRLGIERTAMIRARAGIAYALAEAMDEGHCGLPADEQRDLAAELLEIPPELVDTALQLELAKGAVVADRASARPRL
jgi:hypothetical protein